MGSMNKEESEKCDFVGGVLEDLGIVAVLVGIALVVVVVVMGSVGLE